MNNRLTLLLVSLAAGCCSLAASVTGTWKGTLSVGFTKLPIVFHIAESQNGLSATLDSPNQGAFDIPVTSVAVTADTVLDIKMDNMRASYHGILQPGDSVITGTFTQGGILNLVLHRSAGNTSAADNRPQTPKAPFPYKSKDVTFSHDGITLTGTLTLPQQGSGFPAVVLVSGSGQQNRDEEIMGHKPFLVIADYLTRKGIAVLRYDDRGVGGSTGLSPDNTTLDFAQDAACALAFLKQQPQISPSKCGFIGHSEGGAIAFINAARSRDAAFVISLAGPAVKGSDLMIRQNIMITEAMGKPLNQSQLAQTQAVFAAIAASSGIQPLKDTLRNIMNGNNSKELSAEEKSQIEGNIKVMTSPWYVQFVKYDPTEDLKAIKCPIYALGGGQDVQVDATQNLEAVKRNAKKSNEVTTAVYPDLNHLFQTCKNPQDSFNYGANTETIAPKVLDDIANWILKH